jgi:hypothetical protein
MTLISTFQINNCPILVGDLLISEESDKNNLLNTPTKSNLLLSDTKMRIFRPVGLRQKVNLLSPDLAIAWSGNMDEAVSFYNQVIGSGICKKPSRELLVEIYHDLDNPSELSLIGMLKNESGIQSFWINAEKHSTPHPQIQNIVCAGSGQEGFLSYINNIDFNVSSGTPNNLTIAISHVIGIISALFASEIETSVTLKNLYGAGYEIVHPFGDHLTKFSDITYIFWHIDIQKDQVITEMAPRLAMKYSYYGDILAIRSAHISENKILHEDLHIINPIYSSKMKGQLIKPASLNSNYICSVFETNLNEHVQCFTQVSRVSEKTRPIIFNDNEQGLNDIDINEDFYKSCINKFLFGKNK